MASKINGANSGVSASVLKDISGERLLLRSQSTGLDFGFRTSIAKHGRHGDANAANGGTGDTGISRLVDGSVVTQQAADAKATVNGIPVSSSTNTFSETISGLIFKVEQKTSGPIEIDIKKDNANAKENIEKFISSYNALSNLLNELTKYDPADKKAGIFQGDSSTITLQNTLRSAMQASAGGVKDFRRLANVGITLQRSGELLINSAKLEQAFNDDPDSLKKLFSMAEPGIPPGVAVRLRILTSNLLGSEGFFKTKNDTLKNSLKQNMTEKNLATDRIESLEKRLTSRYNSLDKQMSGINKVGAYVAQQVTTWNKSK